MIVWQFMEYSTAREDTAEPGDPEDDHMIEAFNVQARRSGPVTSRISVAPMARRPFAPEP
jgi:hypothetical protein